VVSLKKKSDRPSAPAAGARRKHPEVPAEIVAKLQLTCLDLPEAYEEQAWVGTRWVVRKKTFAHVLMIEGGWPPAYARAAGTTGPACVLTFRAPAAALESPRLQRPPFFRPIWFPDIVGLHLDDRTDWYEVAALVTHSYRVLAPRKLAEQVERPDS
jgi:hypothetical protein